MMVVMGLKEVGQLGVQRDELLPTTVTIQVANSEVVRALGMVLLVISWIYRGPKRDFMAQII